MKNYEELHATIIVGVVILGCLVLGALAETANCRARQRAADEKARCDSIGGIYSGNKCYVNGEEM